jgi:hypothetical protein
MVLTQPTYSENRSAVIVALGGLLAYWGLFYLDHETQSIADLFKIGNLIALAFYFIPAFFITFFLFVKIRQKKSQTTSMFLAFTIGIPVSFALVIGFFLAIH